MKFIKAHLNKELTKKALELAGEAIHLSGKKALIAGSFPPINVSFRPDLTGTKSELEDFYGTLGEIYKNIVLHNFFFHNQMLISFYVRVCPLSLKVIMHQN